MESLARFETITTKRLKFPHYPDPEYYNSLYGLIGTLFQVS